MLVGPALDLVSPAIFGIAGYILCMMCKVVRAPFDGHVLHCLPLRCAPLVAQYAMGCVFLGPLTWPGRPHGWQTPMVLLTSPNGCMPLVFNSL